MELVITDKHRAAGGFIPCDCCGTYRRPLLRGFIVAGEPRWYCRDCYEADANGGAGVCWRHDPEF